MNYLPVWCLLVSLGLLPATLRANEPLDEIVAIADDEPVMASEMIRMLRRVLAEMEGKNAPLPPLPEMEKQILDKLIIQKLQLQVARRSGLVVDDDALNQAINRVAAQNGVSLGQFRKMIESEGYQFSRFREDIRNEIIIARLKQRDVDSRVNVTEREVDNYLASNPQLGGAGAAHTETRLLNIFVALSEGSSPAAVAAAQRKAESALAELQAGADFAQTAVRVSDGQQALDGGDLGFRPTIELPQAFQAVLVSLKPGGISPVIRVPSGFHIIKLAEQRPLAQKQVQQTHARHILIRTSEIVSKKEALEKIQVLRNRILTGDDFAELAKANSDDRGSAAKGGDLGWANPGEMVPEFENAMDALALNELSPPFESQFGVHIVQVLERREQALNEDGRRAQAKEIIRKRKTDEEYDAWIRRLKDESFVEYRQATPPPEQESSAAATATTETAAPPPASGSGETPAPPPPAGESPPSAAPATPASEWKNPDAAP